MVDCDVAIIGGGPGGYVAAIRAGQLGLNTVCIEMDKTLGGTCVNVGCIPSKALLTSSEHYEFARLHAAEHGVTIGDVKLDLPTMMKRKESVVGQNTKGIEFLFRKNKITWAKGRGTLKKGNVVDVAGSDGKTESYRAKNVIIATGSVPVELPFLKFDEKRVLSNIGALTIPAVPKHLLVIGGGYIGLEMGSVWRRLGAKVTVVEVLDRITPGMDAETGKMLQRILTKSGFAFKLGTKVVGAKSGKSGVTLQLEPAAGGDRTELTADVVLVASGRKPYTDGLGLEEVGVALDDKKRVKVD